MSALRATAKSFQPIPPPLFNIDHFITSILERLPSLHSEEHELPPWFKGYYIKGGKAYHYYYPESHVPSSDYDLVATEHVKDTIFSELYHALEEQMMHSNMVTMDGRAFYIHEVILSKLQTYVDRSPSGEKLRNKVQSLSVFDGTETIAIMDVIIPESYKTVLDETEPPTNQLRYMKKTLFDLDLESTYKDRTKKLRYVHQSMKEETPEKMHKRVSLEHKYQKSKARYETSQEHKKKKHSGRKSRARSLSRRDTRKHHRTSKQNKTKSKSKSKSKTSIKRTRSMKHNKK